ncbi:unnamed protein product [Rhizoctonia solani]|uniref:Autophagy-related protein 29 n=1 Tax=Rhizoctonia solani TaxID=456999 RepID=A0A8H3EBI8_9AGAM|nr:unnamed protein product [Rhizoctonia solani]
MLPQLLSKSVIWSPEKEKVLWDELARPRASLNAINWAGLSAQLDVPVPYLIYRAQVKYEQDLKGLQGIRQAQTVTSPSDDRSFGSPQRTRNPLSSPTMAASPALVRRMSSSGAIGSRWSRGSNASTHTIVQPPGPRMARLNPVLTPLRTATGSRPSSSSSGRSTPTSTDSEEEKRDAQKEEADQLAEKLKELQKRMGSGYFGFAKPDKSPAPSIIASQTRSQSQSASQTRSQTTSQVRSQTARSQTATMSASRIMQRSLTTPTGAAMVADSETSASMSQRGSVPDIPSPASDSRARLPVRVTRRATSVGTHRSPSAVSEAQERGPVGRTRAHDAGSGQVSSASSFSDISDMSASALEDALMSNNFKSTAASRMSMFSRTHHSRGARHGRFP